MSELKEYIVTLHRHEDLEGFYEDMETPGGDLYIPDRKVDISLRRPMSRNTYYLLIEEEAELIKKDERVWDVVLKEEIKFRPRAIVNNSPYTVSGDFWKDADSISLTEEGIFRPSFTADANKHQWGLLHCAGTATQRRKNSSWGGSGTTEVVNDSVTVFNGGKHVDVVIVDDPVSYDCEEWYSPSSNTTRFVEYQWFDNLNQYVSGIDDDGLNLPTGTIEYPTNASNSTYHGTMVASIAAGQFYGWAKESNIYSLALNAWPSGQSVYDDLLTFDYLRAFHLYKPINPETGFRNPTITNHSYGAIKNMPTKTDEFGSYNSLDFSDLISVTYQGSTYDASNPGPAGTWTEANVENAFGIRFGVENYPLWSAATIADVQDCIKDGVVLVGAAGNDNLLLARPNDLNWDNELTVSGGVGTFYYNRGGSPNTPDAGIFQIGNLSDTADFRRWNLSEFGPGVDYFAPGDQIVCSSFDAVSYYRNLGGVTTGFEFLVDSKYTEGSGNWWLATSGTSFSSPQVCGILACAATNKPRFTQQDAKMYLEKTCVTGDMTFDLSGGEYSDPTCSKGSPNKVVACKNPRDESGFINSQKGERKTTGMVFPRRNTLNMV